MDAGKEVDRAILEKLGDTEKVREKLSVERQQVEMRLQNLADEIF
jgi:hypothetical protein